MERLDRMSGRTAGLLGRLARTALVGAAASAAVGAASCQSPTQMRMVLRTDMACDTASGAAYTLNDLSIYVARDDATLQQRMREGIPAAYMSGCTRGPGGELGTLYLTPDGSDTGMVAVMAGLVHTGAGTSTRQSAQTCTSSVQENCLLSTRRFRFTANQTGVVPVLLEASCINHRPECAPGETCRGGVCASDRADDGSPEPVDAGRLESSAVDVEPPLVDAGPPSIFHCDSNSVVWTPDPPADPSCAVAANTERCVTQSKEGPRATCALPTDPACQTPCCTNRLTPQRACCLVDGLPVSRRSLSGCGTDARPCFDKAECDGCSGSFDPALGFGACK